MKNAKGCPAAYYVNVRRILLGACKCYPQRRKNTQGALQTLRNTYYKNGKA